MARWRVQFRLMPVRVSWEKTERKIVRDWLISSRRAGGGALANAERGDVAVLHASVGLFFHFGEVRNPYNIGGCRVFLGGRETCKIVNQLPRNHVC